MAGSTSTAVDGLMANIFEKKIAFDILYQTVHKTNPRINKPEFTLGGLEFRFEVRAINDVHVPYAVFLKLSEGSKKTLLAGYNIQVTKFSGRIVNGIGGFGEIEVTEKSLDEDDSVELFRFRLTKQCDANLAVKFEDVFPHRLQFVDAEAAKKSLSDCKILLGDDGNKGLFVHKAILAMRSAVFHRIFYGDASKQDTLRLARVTEKDFLEYLCCVYPPPNRPLSFKRLGSLLTLAKRFENDYLLSSIGIFLMSNKEKSASEKRLALTYADTYNMPELFRDTLATMSKAELKELKSSTCMTFKKENLELLVAFVFRLL